MNKVPAPEFTSRTQGVYLLWKFTVINILAPPPPHLGMSFFYFKYVYFESFILVISCNRFHKYDAGWSTVC